MATQKTNKGNKNKAKEMEKEICNNNQATKDYADCIWAATNNIPIICDDIEGLKKKLTDLHAKMKNANVEDLNKVYIVEEDVGHDEYVVVSVHKTLEGANNRIDNNTVYKRIIEKPLEE